MGSEDLKVGDIFVKPPGQIECECLAYGSYMCKCSASTEYSFWQINIIMGDEVELDKLKVDYTCVPCKYYKLKNGEPRWMKKANVIPDEVECYESVSKDDLESDYCVYDPDNCYTTTITDEDKDVIVRKK